MKIYVNIIRVTMLIFPFAIKAGSIEYTAQFDKTQISFTMESGYDVIILSGTSYWYKVGAPQLPVKPYTFVVSPKAESIDVKIINVKKEFLASILC